VAQNKELIGTIFATSYFCVELLRSIAPNQQKARISTAAARGAFGIRVMLEIGQHHGCPEIVIRDIVTTALLIGGCRCHRTI
jgi:hypothetical protein